jgi:hypothetical protein
MSVCGSTHLLLWAAVQLNEERLPGLSLQIKNFGQMQATAAAESKPDTERLLKQNIVTYLICNLPC